jgi:hypothetical protein
LRCAFKERWRGLGRKPGRSDISAKRRLGRCLGERQPAVGGSVRAKLGIGLRDQTGLNLRRKFGVRIWQTARQANGADQLVVVHRRHDVGQPRIALTVDSLGQQVSELGCHVPCCLIASDTVGASNDSAEVSQGNIAR